MSEIRNYTDAVFTALSGDETGYRYLYDNTAQTVYTYLLQEAGNAETANELIAKTYDEAWRRLDEMVDDPDSFPDWITRLTKAITERELHEDATAVMNGANASLEGLQAAANTGEALPGMAGGISTGTGQPFSTNAPHAGSSPNVEHVSSAPHMQQSVSFRAQGQTGSGSPAGPDHANQAPGTPGNTDGASFGNAAQTGSTGGQAGSTGGQTGSTGTQTGSTGGQTGSTGGQAAGAGTKAAGTGAKAAGAKTAFLSTVAGKVTVGIGITIAAAVMITGGYLAAKKLHDRKKPKKNEPEVSSAEVNTEDTSSVTEEAVTEAVTTEESTQQGTTEASNEEWKADYLETVSAFEANSEYGESGSGKTYDLIYINDDDIPELICQYTYETIQTSKSAIIYTWKDGKVIQLGDSATGIVEATYYPRKNYVNAGGGRSEMGAVWSTTVWKMNDAGDDIEKYSYTSYAYDPEKYSSAAEAGSDTAFNGGEWYTYLYTEETGYENGIRVDGQETPTGTPLGLNGKFSYDEMTKKLQ